MICPFYDYDNCSCKVGNDLCIGDEYHPEDCDVYIEEHIEEEEEKKR